jgi:spermidine/putrescine transport system ATP-binding protein
VKGTTGLAEAVGIRDVAKRYGATTALHGVALSIADNEFFTLLGPSGCGKTTLLRCIAGFEDVSDGEIALFGAPIAALPPNRRPVNTVFQHYALFPHMTVADNVAFGLRMLGRSADHQRARVAEMLDLVHLTDLAGRLPAQLSGGQQQRVALARALAPAPRVLLLDEPLSALDLKLRQAMRVELKQLQEGTGITFIFVTHDQEEALTMSDRIAVMSGGRVQQVGTAREIYEAPVNRFVAGFIGETNLLPVTVEEVSQGRAQLVLPGGHRLTCPAPDGTGPGAHHVSIRPERLSPAAAGAADLDATVDRLIYLGTDLSVLLRLPDGTPLNMRLQNAARTRPPPPGTPVGIAIDAGAARLLAD